MLSPLLIIRPYSVVGSARGAYSVTRPPPLRRSWTLAAASICSITCGGSDWLAARAATTTASAATLDHSPQGCRMGSPVARMRRLTVRYRLLLSCPSAAPQDACPPCLPAPSGAHNFFAMADLSNLFQLAQQAQGRLSEMQTKLAQETVTVTAGGGMVQATADGRGQIRAIKIDPEAFKAGDVELLEDVILAAVAQAQQRAAELYQAEMKKLTAGLPLPFQLPL